MPHNTPAKRLAYSRLPDRKSYYKQYRERIKIEVLSHYSESTFPSCACCKITIVPFLTIDHIDGGGAEHRRQIGNAGGHAMYLWLKRNAYPEGYRVLCLNCQLGAFHNGGECFCSADLQILARIPA